MAIPPQRIDAKGMAAGLAAVPFGAAGLGCGRGASALFERPAGDSLSDAYHHGGRGFAASVLGRGCAAGAGRRAPRNAPRASTATGTTASAQRGKGRAVSM